MNTTELSVDQSFIGGTMIECSDIRNPDMPDTCEIVRMEINQHGTLIVEGVVFDCLASQPVITEIEGGVMVRNGIRPERGFKLLRK